jgi:hypothetical protein
MKVGKANKLYDPHYYGICGKSHFGYEDYVNTAVNAT